MHLVESTLQQWLHLQCQMVTGVHAASTLCFSADSSSHWPQDISPHTDLQTLLRKCQQKDKLQLAKNKSGEYLLALPIALNNKPWGALALALEPRSKADLNAVIKLLKWGNTWLQLLLQSQPNDNTDTELLNLLAHTLSRKSLDESTITAVNQLASHLQCERVSLSLIHKKTLQLYAISHCAHFDARSKSVATLLSAMSEACEQRSHIHCQPEPHKLDNTQTDALISRDHQALLQLNQTQAVHTFILRKGEQIIGAITVEDSLERPLSASARRFLEHSSEIIAQVFFVKLQATSSIRSRVKTRVSTFLQRRFGTQHLTGKVTLAVLGLMLLIGFIPAQYAIYTDAQLQSFNKRVLVAPQDGYLRDIHIRPGSTVTKGQLLAELDDRDLRLERRKLSSQLQQHRQEYDAATANYDRAEAAILDAQVQQAQAQLQLISQQLERTQLTSPLDGIVVSDDISHNLGAPIQQGQVLFEVASRDQYRVKLFVDERRIAAISRQQTGQLLLTSQPDTRLAFTVSDITPLSTIREGRNYFVVEATLDAHSHADLLRPGMTGSGKIIAGRRALGWIWFHDIINAVRLAMWL